MPGVCTKQILARLAIPCKCPEWYQVNAHYNIQPNTGLSVIGVNETYFDRYLFGSIINEQHTMSYRGLVASVRVMMTNMAWSQD
jgi:hypothetical protein